MNELYTTLTVKDNGHLIEYHDSVGFGFIAPLGIVEYSECIDKFYDNLKKEYKEALYEKIDSLVETVFNEFKNHQTNL